MYKINCDKKFNNNLDIPNFSKRFEYLINSSKTNIVYIKDIFDNSTFRYRTYNMMQALEKSNKFYVICFLIDEIKFLIPNINKITLVILQRCKWSFELENFINILKKHNIKIVYDMDDLIYSTKYVPDYLNNVGYYNETETDAHFALASRYNMIANMCDEFIVTTKKLKENVEKDFNKKAYIYHNFLNKEQEEISNNIIKIKTSKENNNKFIIGYFSGSNSHVRDLETAENALLRMVEKYDNIYVNIVGYMKLTDKMKKLKNKKRLIISPFVTYQELQYLIAQADINIIPLQDNEFNECKSELKYFEASIVNTISIACNNSVYSKIIKNNENGFLVNDYEWFNMLEYVYLNYDKLGNVIKNARDYCIENYSVYNQNEKLERLFNEIIGNYNESR